MDTDVAKGKPLSKEETKTLLELVEKSTIITTKATNATNNKLKTEEWKRLTHHFNATALYPRTPQQLRLKWENLKKNSRKRSTKIRMNRIQTGGGAGDYIPSDDILDKVSSLLGSTGTGFTVSFGGDKEPEEFVVGGCETVNDHREEDKFTGGDPTASVQDVVNTDGPSEVSRIIVLDGEHVVAQTPSLPKRLTFSTPRVVKKKKQVQDSNRTARNLAIAEYYTSKKLCLDAKLNNILLQNEKMKLENDKLKLEIEKLSSSC